MGDHCEEQEMEAEALTAIFDDSLEIISNQQPFEWAITLYPEALSEGENHVGIKLVAKIPLDYPEISLPELEIVLLKGLIDEHKQELTRIANEEAEANLGLPSIFAVCERLKEWLSDNNVKGLDDVSMFAQMKRREKEKEKQTQKANLQFESQKQVDELTQAEQEELAVRKRRAEGTPCTKENFEAWKAKFEKELEMEKENREKLAEQENVKRKKGDKGAAVEDKTGRITGVEQFKRTGDFNLEAIEAAAENAQVDEDEVEADAAAAAAAENLQVDEDLFDVDDDDLDDLDFDDDDDEEDDDEDETPDI